jgi:hypothetical protein
MPVFDGDTQPVNLFNKITLWNSAPATIFVAGFFNPTGFSSKL